MTINIQKISKDLDKLHDLARELNKRLNILNTKKLEDAVELFIRFTITANENFEIENSRKILIIIEKLITKIKEDHPEVSRATIEFINYLNKIKENF
jgi:hypothetical protein